MSGTPAAAHVLGGSRFGGLALAYSSLANHGRPGASPRLSANAACSR